MGNGLIKKAGGKIHHNVQEVLTFRFRPVLITRNQVTMAGFIKARNQIKILVDKAT